MILSIIEAVVVITLLGVSHAQQQQQPDGQQQPTPCMDQFNTNLAQRCFNSRGVSWEGTLNMMTQGQQGVFPTNTTRDILRALLCREDTLDYIVPCSLQLSSYYMNQTSCQEQERMAIVGSARQLTGILAQFCLQPCEIETNQRAMQCFASAQIDPNRAMNTTMLADKFQILGNTTLEVQRFCSNHGTLFTCLEAEKATCPAFEKRMFEEGVDFTAMKQATAVLCQKQQEYMAAVQCFTQNQPSLQPCVSQTGRSVQELLMGRIALGTVAPSQMTGRLCALRINLVPCELNIYRQTCQANLNQLRNEFECNILASPCRSEPTLSTSINQMCQTSPPPHQTITQRPPVVINPANKNINNFTPNNNNNNNNNNNMNTNNNNNKINTANVGMSGDGNGGVGVSGSILTTVVLIISAVLLH